MAEEGGVGRIVGPRNPNRNIFAKRPRTLDAEGPLEAEPPWRPSADELAHWLGGHEFLRVVIKDGRLIAQVELRESPSEYGRFLLEHSMPCAGVAPPPVAPGALDAPALPPV